MSNLIFSRQIDNFSALVVITQSLGNRWAPKQTYLTTTKLQERLVAFRELHDKLNENETAYRNHRQTRTKLIQEGIEKAKCIRWTLENILPKEDDRIQRLKVLFREINSSPKSRLKSDEKANRSLSQRSFSDRLDQFIRLKSILAETSEYVAESEDLTKEKWAQLLNDLYESRENCQTSDAEEDLDRELRMKAQMEITQLKNAIKRHIKISQLQQEAS